MDFSRLKRDIHPIPEDVKRRLNAEGLRDAYHARPPYQRNDYIGWITRAKRDETRSKRIGQMIEELHDGNVYMGMDYHRKQQ